MLWGLLVSWCLNFVTSLLSLLSVREFGFLLVLISSWWKNVE